MLRTGENRTAMDKGGILNRRDLYARWGLGLVAASFCGLASSAPACPVGGGEAVELASVEARLELRLTDGRLLRLAGLDPALATPETPDREDQARALLAEQLAGQPLHITLLTMTPDRWGRYAAWAFTSQNKEGGVTAAAIAAGLGRFLAEPLAAPCQAALTSDEAAARAQKLGLWADPYYAVLAAGDFAGFAERAGTLVVAEGRVGKVETSPYRSKLIFAGDSARFHGSGSRGSQILSATIAPRITKLFEARGMPLTSLNGRWIRVRGLLDLRFGPEIELSSPVSLETIAPPPGEPAPVSAK